MNKLLLYIETKLSNDSTKIFRTCFVLKTGHDFFFRLFVRSGLNYATGDSKIILFTYVITKTHYVNCLTELIVPDNTSRPNNLRLTVL